ncbi:MAG: hypothetical protein II727_01470, partial [Oscillospiraceae bacterium]|nr:hypothetical protein [Oscillospiraceae bacterium]
MVIFSVKEDNSEKTFSLALDKAKALDTDIVIATTSGNTALRFLEAAKKADFAGKTVVVTHAYGSREKGKNIMPEDVRACILESGAVVVTAAHALS